MRLGLRICRKLSLILLVIPLVLTTRLIRPWLLVRWGNLYSLRIGHFAANTELYLCERDAGIDIPRQRHVDIFSLEPPVCNQQLAKMWKRVLCVWPFWITAPIHRANRLIPGGAAHEIGNPNHSDRDVHNLLDHFPSHLRFTPEEEDRGEAGLRMMGIPAGATFVCLIARDSAYLNAHIPGDWDYHNYRDTNIQNYVLAAEELADRGYFVVRMGANVREAINSDHSRVIDYAANGMRSDFMDIYLGAKCEFCISGVSGFEAVPLIFRRPIASVNMVPLGLLFTFWSQLIGITRHYYSLKKNRELTLGEIFANGAGYYLHTADYETEGIQLIENTREELRDVAIEMAERLRGTWRYQKDDEALQQRFWEIFPVGTKTANGRALHGEIRARIGAAFLRNNREWLE